MSIGDCGDPSAVQGTAVELFQLAALLLGDQVEAVGLVEETMAQVEIDPCLEPAAARRLARQQLLAGALTRLQETEPVSFTGVGDLSGSAAVCVEDENLGVAGISHAQLSEWLASEGRQDLRDWLRALPAAQRVIFVQRAVLGQGNAATAEVLQASTGASAHQGSMAWWTPQAVGEMYRLALCSLANSLAHSPGALASAARA